MRLDSHVECTGKIIQDLVENTKGERVLERLGIDGKNSNKMKVKAMVQENVNWIDMAHDRDK